MGEMSVILLVLAVAFCWSQSASNANVAQFSATPDFTFAATEIGSASVQQELKRSDERTSPTSTQAISTINLNSEEDLLQSKICETCACQDGTPSVVDCSSKSLTAPFLLPEWPQGHLISSIDARFENNNFIEVRQFPELPLLKLSFRGNGIQFIEKEAFKFLKMLEYLDLSENNLTHESLNENVFIGPFNDEDYEPIPLKTLKLGYNKIVSINNDAFKHLSHLETLELNNNPLKVIDHQTAIAITTLRKLKTLNLAETYLASVPSGFFHALTSLQMLVFNGNQFVTIPEELQHAIHLEYLNLNNNPIKTLNKESFQGLSKLKRLNISAMPYLENIDDNTFTPLTSMTSLWCSFNPALKQIHSGAFNNMAQSDETLQLSEVYFRGNNIKSFSKSLLPWTTLEIVDITENPFVCDCNIGWMVTDLLPLISEKTPEFAISVSCSEPETYKNQTLESLVSDKNIVNCSNPIDNGSGDNNHHGSDIPLHRGSSKGLIIVSLFGIVSVVGGMVCFVLLAVKKSHLRELYDTNSGQIVHYVRTKGGQGKQEDERAIVEREFNQYYEEP